MKEFLIVLNRLFFEINSIIGSETSKESKADKRVLNSLKFMIL